MALSTAFEDFALNTAEHTRALVERGTLVGATRKALGRDTYPGTISFPVGVDAGIERGIGETFARNRLRGTPSWFVLGPGGTLLAGYFGRLPLAEGLRSGEHHRVGKPAGITQPRSGRSRPPERDHGP